MVLVIAGTLAAVAASIAVAAATIVALTAPAAPTGAAGSVARPSVAVVMVASAVAAAPPDGALLTSPPHCQMTVVQHCSNASSCCCATSLHGFHDTGVDTRAALHLSNALLQPKVHFWHSAGARLCHHFREAFTLPSASHYPSIQRRSQR